MPLIYTVIECQMENGAPNHCHFRLSHSNANPNLEREEMKMLE